MFKADSFVGGALTGLLFPALSFVILFGLRFLVSTLYQPAQNFTITKIMFVSAALNVLPMRYFFVSKEQPKTAQGVLLLTVILIITILLVF